MRDRRNFNPVFAVAAASYATGAAASIGFSPTSTLSSVSSSEVSDFVADFRQAYNNLRCVTRVSITWIFSALNKRSVLHLALFPEKFTETKLTLYERRA